MSPNPGPFLDHLREHGYHSRSDKHSNALAEAIVADLLATCGAIRSEAAAGRLVYTLNFTLMAGTAEWNVDLVLGRPAGGVEVPEVAPHIVRAAPATVRIAIELKSVMTAHRKAVKNRKRDLEAHHEHVHNYDHLAIAGGVLVINAAATFQSPLRSEVTAHKRPEQLVRHCVDQLRAVTARSGTAGNGLDAKCALVVRHDNIDHAVSSFVTGGAAPTIGDPLHYDSFLGAICDQYHRRFGG